MKRIGIIGAGRFGSSLAESLAEHGAEVLLIDQNREVIQELSEFVTRAVEGDVTNQRTLEDAGFQECDVVVVAIGNNLEGSIMATVNCKALGVPTVVAKANSDVHGKILQRVGADMVVYPNRDIAPCAYPARRFRRSFPVRAVLYPRDRRAGISRNKSLAQTDARKHFGGQCRRLAEDRPNRALSSSRPPTRSSARRAAAHLRLDERSLLRARYLEN